MQILCHLWDTEVKQLYFIKEILNSKYLVASLASLVAQMVKNPPTMQETWAQSLGWEDLLEKEMAPHHSPPDSPPIQAAT